MLLTDKSATDTRGVHLVAPWRPNDYIAKLPKIQCDHLIVTWRDGGWRCDCGEKQS
jgi:hypothetical protein